MKLSSFSLIIISLVLGILTVSNKSFQKSPESLQQDTISGTWLGELVIPNTAKLRMGVSIFKTADDSYKAVLNIIDQATGDIPCDEVYHKNDSVIIRINGLRIEIAGVMTTDHNSITCEFRQGGGILPVSFSRVDKLPVLLRPQEPQKPYPYNEEDVAFENLNAGIKLAGTLTFPGSGGKYPAVVLATGSGQQDRNETIGGHKPFLVIADYLTRNGIAVLRVDDRGTGGSSGNFNTSTTKDFSDDALAAVVYLKSRPEIDPEKIGIIGHSEGGVVSALSASNSSDVAFIVSMAGVFVNFEDVVIEQLLNQQKQQGRNDDDLELEKNWRTKIYSLARENTDSSTAAKKLWSLYDGLTEDEVKRLNWPRGRHEAQIKQVLNPWWRYALALDNKAVLLKVPCPILAVYGELDQQVNPGKNIDVIEEALKTGSNKDISVKEFPGLNHLFQTAGTGSEYEYIRIEETISPVALQAITDWISKKVK